jgi:mono/diheme cytochrome c family protein
MLKVTRPVLLLVAFGTLVTACELTDDRAEIAFSLNEKILAENGALARDPKAQAHISGALEMLFGTPDAPGYMRPEQWIDDGFDPNFGQDELGEEHLARIWEENEEHFSRPPVSGDGLSLFALIEAGRFDEAFAKLPREALSERDYWQEDVLPDWNELRGQVERGVEGAQAELDAYVAEWATELRDGLTRWYPRLRDSAELYRIQCMHCHGNSGGGDGTTARFLNPRPRDYRYGIFKFTALADKARPRREDLHRVLDEGVYLTAMPSFRRFSEAQLQGLVDYVRLLSIRGETELLLSVEYDEDDGLPIEVVQETYLDVWSRWDASTEHVIAYDGEIPEATPARIAHGRELFMDATSANCFSCHGATGRGDGDSSKEVDAATGEKVWRKDDWGNEIRPRDLNSGIFRGGRRPIDIFRRIYAGINGTPMPSHASLKNSAGDRLLSDEDLWDIVHYVRSLSSHPADPVESGPSGH